MHNAAITALREAQNAGAGDEGEAMNAVGRTGAALVVLLLTPGFGEVGPAAVAQGASGEIGGSEATGEVVDPTVQIGSVEVPADCPLARNQHPRLLFSRGDLPAIKARLTHSPLKEDLQLLKRTLDEGLARGSERARNAIVALGVLYHLTGDRRYGEACKEAVLKRGSFGVYAALGLYGYDLVYDLMTPAERRQCEEKSVKFLRGNKWRQRARFIHAVGVYGSGTEDEFVAGQISELYPWLLKHREGLNRWARYRGGDGNSHGYIGQHEYVGTMGAIQAWRTATGEDLLEGFDWARLMAPYYIYHYPPGRRDTVHVGINCWGNNRYPAETGANNFVSLAQAYWKDGVAWWWIQNRIVGRKHDYHIYGKLWGPLLWSDPTVPQVAPEDLPPTMLFRERGYVCMRSDWSDDAVYGHFHCGRFESDGRNNADNNSFIIFRKGYLACDTGTRGLNNPENKEMSDGRHHNRYFIQTIAHNSITVGTDHIPGKGWTAVCSGQVSRPAREWVQRWGLPATADTLYTPYAGTMLAYQTHPLFDYAAGDASRSYSPDYVKNFTRQFVYVRPGLFVVFDRVSSVRAEDPKRWYLHTMEEPTLLDGREERDSTVHPEGHFLWKGTTGRAAHKGSALFWKTLLPKQVVIRKIGGKGHQFEVNGENYDMYDVWYERLGQDFFDRIGLGMWRIEVEPGQEQTEDLFLHVLWATDGSARRMLPTELIETSDSVGARIRAPGTEVAVTFATTGPVSGHITIRKGAATVLDSDLATEVVDTYEAWRDDPRYGRWMTDPYYQGALRPMPSE